MEPQLYAVRSIVNTMRSNDDRPRPTTKLPEDNPRIRIIMFFIFTVGHSVLCGYFEHFIANPSFSFSPWTTRFPQLSKGWTWQLIIRVSLPAQLPAKEWARQSLFHYTANELLPVEPLSAEGTKRTTEYLAIASLVCLVVVFMSR